MNKKNKNINILEPERGQAMITATMFFLAGILIVLSGVAGPLLQDKQNIRQMIESKQSYFFAEGAIEEVVYRIVTAGTVASQVILIDGIYTATTTVSDVLGSKEVEARGDVSDAIRKIKIVLEIGEGVSFNFGMQSDSGGVYLKNTSSVLGNIFSNGPVVGETSNSVSGSVISADSTGLIDGVNIGEDAFANTIQDSSIGRDAYYQTISGSVWGGTPYPSSSDQATSSLPISDETVDLWKAQAEAGGVITDCPYTTNSDITLGPVKINCDMTIGGHSTVTLTGMVWVKGNFTVQNNVVIQADASLGNTSVVIIADGPADPSNKGLIDLRNSTSFQSNGQTGSYILVLSQNNSAETGGDIAAIQLGNSTQGDLLVYAGHGKIELQNNVSIKEVSAWKIEAQNSAEIVYEGGLVSTLFTSGPSGGYSLTSWEEIE
jgi:hypothetical protein